MVVVKAHRSIPLVVPVDASMRAVDRNLVVVGSNAMTMCVRVREQTTLQVCTQKGVRACACVCVCAGTDPEILHGRWLTGWQPIVNHTGAMGVAG